MPGGEEQKPLFDYVLIIKLKNENGTLTPIVDYRFPPSAPKENDEKKDSAKAIAQFCFPELEVWEQTINQRKNNQIKGEKSETFNFVLTEGDGSKKFGYCRRYVIDSQPECFCVLSFLPCVSLFVELLNAIEQLRKKSSSAVFSFLRTVLAKQFPNPGETISIRTFDGPTFNLTRSDNNFLLDLVSFKKLFTKLTITDILNLFAGVITESRVIIIAQNVSTLSAAVSALNGLIYPFSWQFVYIPILPQPLLTYTCAPMPFLVGVLSCNKKELLSLPIDEALILDVDNGQFIRPIPENSHYKKVIPSSLIRQLKFLLKEDTAKYLSQEPSDSVDKQFDVDISKIFLGFFHQIFGNYQSFITSHTFNAQRFKESKPEDVQQFLNLFGETQMYNMFIEERQEMSKCGKLNLCTMTSKIQGRMTWCEESEVTDAPSDDEKSVKSQESGQSNICCLCECFTEDDKGVRKKNKFYCLSCYEQWKNKRQSFSLKGIQKMGGQKLRNIRESVFPGSPSTSASSSPSTSSDQLKTHLQKEASPDSPLRERKEKEEKKKEPKEPKEPKDAKEKETKDKSERIKDLLGKASSSSKSAAKMLSQKMKAITSADNLKSPSKKPEVSKSSSFGPSTSTPTSESPPKKENPAEDRKSEEAPTNKVASSSFLLPGEKKWGKPNSLPSSPKSRAEIKEKKSEYLSVQR
eukprot:TRINITY_DN3368_c0_g1_i3.p1 TRINITY_DN3368_c0_g1~~TRINITY_DN3368_c0_g1_i3.p1  ORF type:complete len:691 (+),score=220.62 TRINITY_DN3368_c0_g1_i3:186-2258(+)